MTINERISELIADRELWLERAAEALADGHWVSLEIAAQALCDISIGIQELEPFAQAPVPEEEPGSTEDTPTAPSILVRGDVTLHDNGLVLLGTRQVPGSTLS